MEGEKSDQSEGRVLVEALRQEAESLETGSHHRSLQALEGFTLQVK